MKRQDRRPAPEPKMAKPSMATVSLPWVLRYAGMMDTQIQEQIHTLRVTCFASLKGSGRRQAGKATSKLTGPSKPKQHGTEQFQGALVTFSGHCGPRLCRVDRLGGSPVAQSVHKVAWTKE